MKRIIILAIVLFTAVTFNAEAKRHYNGVGGYFYTELSPYGSWIEVDHGVVVWRPTIIRVNWMPYQMGRWVWTYDGWYWDSYEPFGFITYHYGRWYYDDYYGWLWYPDYEWAPAWVEWRYDNDYIGWAPLHPYATFSISIGIFWSNTYYSPYHHYNYVTYNYFCDPYVYNYYVEPGYKYRIHSGTKYRHDYGYRNGRVQNRGIDVSYVSTRSGQKIKQRDIVRVSDSRELKRDSYGNRDEVRALDIKRDELVRNELGRMEIKKENRRTSLDVDKVQIGKRENISSNRNENKSTDRNVDIRKNDQSRNDIKTGVDKIFDKNRTDSNRKSDLNTNRTRENVEKRSNETVRTDKRVDTNQRKNDQNKKDIKTGVDKIFDKSRTDSNRNSDLSSNRTRENVEKRTNETVRTDKRIDTNQRKNENITRNEKKVVDQNRTRTNETRELNRQNQQQTKEVKRENTRVNTNEQVKRNEVKVEKRNDVQQRNNSDTNVKSDRTTEKNNSREKSRR